MKNLKKALLVFAIPLLALFLLRGILFRWMVEYKDLGNRAAIYITDQELISKIDALSADRVMDMEAIVDVAQEIATAELSLTYQWASNDPNELVHTHRANCVGYAALFNSSALYLIEKHKLKGKVKAEHKIGQLYLWSVDLHQFFDSPFFKDHDFNTVTHLETGKMIAVDPSLDDYLRIDHVSMLEHND